MSFKAKLRISVFVTLAILFVAPVAVSATDRVSKLHRLHQAREHAAIYRTHRLRQDNALPYRPEYGFLDHVPPNAIRMPGYTFVPGVGILGASCDLPTSACSNEYRDIQ